MNRVKLNYSGFSCLSSFILVLLIAAIPIFSYQGQSRNAVIDGVVTSTNNGTLIIKTHQGSRTQIFLTDETNILRDDVEFSIANIDQAVLPPSSIRVGSRLEIVAQYREGRYVAGIVTVISSDQRWNGILAKNSANKSKDQIVR